MELRVTDIHLPLRRPLQIAIGKTVVKHNLLVELSQAGMTGYGECMSGVAYRETPVTMRDFPRIGAIGY